MTCKKEEEGHRDRQQEESEFKKSIIVDYNFTPDAEWLRDCQRLQTARRRGDESYLNNPWTNP